jgi:hypothetical protein
MAHALLLGGRLRVRARPEARQVAQHVIPGLLAARHANRCACTLNKPWRPKPSAFWRGTSSVSVQLGSRAVHVAVLKVALLHGSE